MGFYIETAFNKYKARQIKEQYDAEQVTVDEARTALADGKGVVCVVDNGPFEAAGFAFDEDEFDVFAYEGDRRPKVWLVMDRAVAEKASGFR